MIDKIISDLGIWKGENKRINIEKVRYLLTAGILLLFLLLNKIFNGFPIPFVEQIVLLVMLILLIQTILRDLRIFLVIFLPAVTFELINLMEGIPFGIYTYSETYNALGFLGVPVVVPLMIVTAMIAIIRVIKSPILLLGFGTVFLIFFEKFNFISGVRFWNENSILIAPFKYYFSWMLIFLIFSFVVRKHILSNSKLLSFLSVFLLLIYLSVSISIKTMETDPMGLVLGISLFVMLFYNYNKERIT